VAPAKKSPQKNSTANNVPKLNYDPECISLSRKTPS